MPKLKDKDILIKFKEKLKILSEQGKLEDDFEFFIQDGELQVRGLPNEQILDNYNKMMRKQTERFEAGEIPAKNTLRETLELFKKQGKSSYWQLRSSQKIAKNLLGTGYEFSDEEKAYLESVEKGRQSNNFRKKGREPLFEIVKRVNEWYENSSNDPNIDRQAHYAIFGS